MYSLSVLATVFATFLVATPSALAAPSCNVAIKTRSSRPNRLTAGSTFVIKSSVQNTGSTLLQNLYFQLQLPDFLVPTKAVAHNRLVTGGKAPVLQGSFVSFPNLTLAARKKLLVNVKVGVPTCQPKGAVEIQALAYRLDSKDVVTCSNAASPYKLDVVTTKSRKWHTFTGGDCDTPPTFPENTRCLEAVPVGSRRRELTKTKARQQRELRTYTKDECLNACATSLNTLPFYYNLDGDGNCFCCATCTLAFAQGWQVRSCI